MPTIKPERFYISKVTVRISGVPFDMMRYDNCVPATESEAGKLEAHVNHHRREPTDSIIVFRRFARQPGPPTVDRWKSFNCEVLSWEYIR